MSEENYNNDLSLDDIFSRLKKEKTGTGEEVGVPFKFLDSYTIEDRNIFFGREIETDEIYRKMYSGKLMLVYGKSGTGKSSIVNCGLVSKIPKEDLFTINIRCSKSAYKNFLRGIKKYSAKETNNPVEILEDVYYENSKPLALIFDQFEEVFILSDKDQRQKLVSALSEILISRLKINVILVIREEFFASLTEFEMFIPGIYDYRVRIEQMSKSAAIKVITEPCRVCNVGIEEGLPDKILDHLTAHSGGLELTWLQILMDKMYKNAMERDPVKPVIRDEDLLKLGRMGNVLSDFLDEQLQQMRSGDQGEVVLKTMISNDGTKKQVTISDISDTLQAVGATLSDREIAEILRYFVKVRIITDQDEQGLYELRHDAIASRIFERMTATEKELVEIKTFLDNSYNNYKKRSVLLAENDLNYIAVYESHLTLNSELKEFIRISKKELQKAKQRRRNLALTIALALIIILSGFTIWAVKEQSKALRHSKVAEEQKEEALNANLEAEKARTTAIEEKAKAESNEELARIQQQIAEEQRKEAILANTKAEYAKEEALEEKTRALENEQLALEAREESENARNETARANREAKFFLYQFNGKELANKSLVMQEDRTLIAMLAMAAYDLVRYGYGNFGPDKTTLIFDNEILESLQRAYLLLESDSLVAGEIWSVVSKKEKIVYSNKSGELTLSSLEILDPKNLPDLVTETSIDLPTQSLVRSIAIHPSEDLIACGTLDGNVSLIDLTTSDSTGQKIAYNHNGNRVLHLAFVPGKNWLVSSSTDGTLQVWDFGQQKSVSKLQLDGPVQKFVVINQDHLVYTNSEGEILDWDMINTDRNPEVLYTHESGKPLQSLAYDTTHKLLITSSYGEILIFPLDQDSTEMISPQRLTLKHKALISQLEFSPDHNWLVSASQDAILLWNLKHLERNNSDKLVPIVIDNNRMIFSLAFDFDTRYILWGDNRMMHRYPIDIDEIYTKLRIFTQGNELSEQEWNYYVKGDLERPSSK